MPMRPIHVSEVRDLIKNLGAHDIELTYRKADGSTRPVFAKADKPVKEAGNKGEAVSLYDTERQARRSFRYDRIAEITTDDFTYMVITPN